MDVAPARSTVARSRALLVDTIRALRSIDLVDFDRVCVTRAVDWRPASGRVNDCDFETRSDVFTGCERAIDFDCGRASA